MRIVQLLVWREHLLALREDGAVCRVIIDFQDPSTPPELELWWHLGRPANELV